MEKFRPLRDRIDLNSGGSDDQRWCAAIGIARVPGTIQLQCKDHGGLGAHVHLS